MPKTARLLLTLAALFLPVLAQTAHAQLIQNWKITDFQSTIEIKKDSSITVTEQITADFTTEPHHGIFRFIPTLYQDNFGSNYKLRLNLLEVTDENNQNLQVQTSRSKENTEFKIGDPDVYLTNIHTFKISYEVKRAIRFFDQHDELYWNVTGNDWLIPIQNTTARIIYPAEATGQTPKLTCFTGQYGSTEKNCEMYMENERTGLVKVNYTLEPGSGLTIATALPKGILTPPPPFTKITDFLIDNWPIFIPLITFLILFRLWYTRGRDPKQTQTIIPLFELPKNLSPAEAGTIIDEKVDVKDITATIIDLAIRGHLTIEETTKKSIFWDSKDFIFKKTTPPPEKSAELKPHEKTLLEGIFKSYQSINLSDLKNKFYTHIPAIQKNVYEQLTKGGYFAGNPDKTRKKYLIIGILVGIFVEVAVIIFQILQTSSILNMIIAPLTGAIIILFGLKMPRKTNQGSQALNHILGLEEYIQTAEKDRLKFQENEKILIEKILPFAMALGIVEKWAETFAPLLTKPPTWYTSGSGSWDMPIFVSSLNNLNSQMNTTLQSAPRSSGSSGFGGGGFSGGGFGGGGGGGW